MTDRLLALEVNLILSKDDFLEVRTLVRSANARAVKATSALQSGAI